MNAQGLGPKGHPHADVARCTVQRKNGLIGGRNSRAALETTNRMSERHTDSIEVRSRVTCDNIPTPRMIRLDVRPQAVELEASKAPEHDMNSIIMEPDITSRKKDTFHDGTRSMDFALKFKLHVKMHPRALAHQGFFQRQRGVEQRLIETRREYPPCPILARHTE